MKAMWNNTIIAESNDTVEIEGNQYFPPESVDKGYLQPSETHTTCPWKGEASYYDVVVDSKVNKDAAWYYPIPKTEAIKIVGHDFANYVGFWRGIEIKER